MKKRTLSIFLAICMMLSVFPIGIFAAETPETSGLPVNTTYELGSEEAIELEGYGGQVYGTTSSLNLFSGEIIRICAHGVNEPLWLYVRIYGPNGDLVSSFGGGSHDDGKGIDVAFTAPSDGAYTVTVFGVNLDTVGPIAIYIDYLCSYPYSLEEMLNSSIAVTGNALSEKLWIFDEFMGITFYEGDSVRPARFYAIDAAEGDRIKVKAQTTSANYIAASICDDSGALRALDEGSNGSYIEDTFTVTAAGRYYVIVYCEDFLYNGEIDIEVGHATSDILLLEEALNAAPLHEGIGYYYAPTVSEYQNIIIDGAVRSAYIVHKEIPQATTLTFSYGVNIEYDGEVYLYCEDTGYYMELLHQNYDNYLSYGEQGSICYPYFDLDCYLVFVWDFDPNDFAGLMLIDIDTFSPSNTFVESKFQTMEVSNEFYYYGAVTYEDSDFMSCGYYADEIYARQYLFDASEGDGVYAELEYEDYPDFEDLDVLLYKMDEYGNFDFVEKQFVENGSTAWFDIPEDGTYGIAFIADTFQYPAGRSFILSLELPIPASVSIDEYYKYLPTTSLETEYSVTETMDLRNNYHSSYSDNWSQAEQFSSGHIKVDLTAGERISVSAYSADDPKTDTTTIVFGYDDNGKIVGLQLDDHDNGALLGYGNGEIDNVFIAPTTGTYGIAYGVYSVECSGEKFNFSVRSLGAPENLITPSEAAAATDVTSLPYEAVVTPGYGNYYYLFDAEDNGGELGTGYFGTTIKADLEANTTVYLTAYRLDENTDNASRDTAFHVYSIDENGKANYVCKLDVNNYLNGGERNLEFTPDTAGTYLFTVTVLDEGADKEYYVSASTEPSPYEETFLYDGTYPENTAPSTSPVTDEFTITNDRFRSYKNPVMFGKLYTVDTTDNTAVNIVVEGKDEPVDLRIEFFNIVGDGNYGMTSAYINRNNTEDGKGENITFYPNESGRMGIFVYSPYETDVGKNVSVKITTDIPMRLRDDLLDSAVSVTEFPYTDDSVVIGELEAYLDGYGNQEAGRFYKIDAEEGDIYTVKSRSTAAMGSINTKITVYGVDENGDLAEIGYVNNDTVDGQGEEYRFTVPATGTYYVFVWMTSPDWRWDLYSSFEVSVKRIPEPFKAATDVTEALPFEFDHVFGDDDIITLDGYVYHGRVLKMTMEKDEAVELIFGSADSSNETDTTICVYKKTETGRECVISFDNDGYNGFGERVLFTASEAGEYYFVFRSFDSDHGSDTLRGYVKSGEGIDFATSVEEHSTEVTVPYIGSFMGNDLTEFYDCNGSYFNRKLFNFSIDTAKTVTVATFGIHQFPAFRIYGNTGGGWKSIGAGNIQTGGNSTIGYFNLDAGEYCISVGTQGDESAVNVVIEAFDTDADSHALDFTDVTEDMSGDKWEWVAETKTLTLHDGFELRTVNCAAITLPADSTVVIDGAVRVTAFRDNAFECSGALTVTAGSNGGQLTIDFSAYGFHCDDYDLNLSGLEITRYGYGWFNYSGTFTATSCYIDIHTVGGYSAIRTTVGGVTFNYGSLKIVSGYSPIRALYGGSGEVVLNCRYDIAITSRESNQLIRGEVTGDRNALFYGDADPATPLFEGALDSSEVTYGIDGSCKVNGVVVRRIKSVLTPPYALGDMNCDGRVNARDLLQLRLAVAGNITVDEEQLALANINCDRAINARDVLLLRLIIAGKFTVNN